MNFVQDDCFYYLTVASNLASGKGSTFNGIVHTNGYHPLWLWTLTLVTLAGSGSRYVPAFLAVANWTATMAAFFLGRRLLTQAGVNALASTALAVYVAVYAMHVFNYGMEVTLTIPLIFALFLVLARSTWWAPAKGTRWLQGTAVGMLTSLMVLSRIDTLILAALIAIAIGSNPRLRRYIDTELVASVILGLLPLLLYAVLNKVYFGTWLPISGLAKQLKLDHGFTALAWKSLLGKTPAQLLNLAPIVLSLILLPFRWDRLSDGEQSFVPAALAFPFIYLTLFSWLSDWSLWGWYFYVLRPALIAAFIVLFKPSQDSAITSSRSVQLLLVLFACTRLISVRLPEQQPEIVAAALAIKEFSQTHPGRYAMGDRSGAVGYLVDQPIVQTEGLMMDRRYVALINQQLPLRAVLRKYNVAYFIGTAMHPFEGCFQADEPAQAGPHAPHTRAEFCEPPVAHWTFDGVQTMIFDLRDELRVPLSNRDR